MIFVPKVYKPLAPSSADRMKVTGNLKQIGLPAESFAAVITGSDVTQNKPDPEIFLKAAAAMKVAPQHCLVVEDAPAGCQGARAAGMACLGITSSFTADTLLEAGAMWTALNLANVPGEVPV
ncbi:MAG: HAD family phosphatase [Phycisphaerales bacterium]|nr:HAD family phosphatase [Phycisphaerales bacterium]